MSRRLTDLSDRFRPLAIELIAYAVEANIPLLIVSTLRTPAEQAALLASGHSWTTHSKHLTGDAMDVAPYQIFQLHGPDKLNWDLTDPAWKRLGQIGEDLGLLWGGRWKVKDLSHFEYPLPPATPSPTRA